MSYISALQVIVILPYGFTPVFIQFSTYQTRGSRFVKLNVYFTESSIVSLSLPFFLVGLVKIEIYIIIWFYFSRDTNWIHFKENFHLYFKFLTLFTYPKSPCFCKWKYWLVSNPEKHWIVHHGNQDWLF